MCLDLEIKPEMLLMVNEYCHDKAEQYSVTQWVGFLKDIEQRDPFITSVHIY